MKHDILIVVTTEAAAPYLAPLISAAQRARASLAVFLTNDGVKLASVNALGNKLSTLDTAVVCAESWSSFVPDEESIVTMGSQTDHSQLIGSAGIVVSL